MSKQMPEDWIDPSDDVRPLPQPSWVIVLKDGRYCYAWGATAEQAKKNYLLEWEMGIKEVRPASDFSGKIDRAYYVPVVSESLRNG